MTTNQLASALAERVGLTPRAARHIVQTLFGGADAPGILADVLRADEPVRLPGFGTFAPTTRKAHLASVPVTGAPVAVPERRTCSFRPGRELKALLNS